MLNACYVFTDPCLVYDRRYQDGQPNLEATHVDLPPLKCVSHGTAKAARALYNATAQKYMDSYRYFSQPQIKVSPPTPSPLHTLASSQLFSMDEFFDHLNLHILRIVFFGLDVLILLYRLSHIYLNCHKLCLGFEERAPATPEELKMHQDMVLMHGEHKDVLVPLAEDWTGGDLAGVPDDMTLSGQNTGHKHSQTMAELYDGESSSTLRSDIHAADAQKYSKHKPNGNAVPVPELREPHYSSAPSSQVCRSAVFIPKRDCTYISRAFVDYLVDSELIPKLAIASALLVFIYSLLMLVSHLFAVEFFLQWTRFPPLASALEMELDYVYQFVELVSKAYSDSVATWYNKHMESELLQLQALLNFFNHGTYVRFFQ